MSQHFLLSARARASLSAAMRMTDQEAEAAFRDIRWATTAGKPVCSYTATARPSTRPGARTAPAAIAARRAARISQ